MSTSELRKLIIAAIAAVVVPAAVIVGTWAVWHSVPAARLLVATSGQSPVSPGRTIPAPAARLARGQSARTVSVPREIRAAAPGETMRGGVIHVAVTHAPVALPATFEIGPAPQPDVCVTCRGNVLEVNF